MIWEGMEVQSRTDYILGTDCRLFVNVSVRNPRHNSDHYMVLGCLHSSPLREHARYLGGLTRLLLCPLTAPTREDVIFAALRRAVLKPLDQEARKNAWISEATWRFDNKRVSARWDIANDQSLIQMLGRAIKPSLQDDRKRQEEEVGA